MAHDACCQGSHILEARLGKSRRCSTSLCELERRGVRRPLKCMRCVVLFAAPLLACAVPQSCWTSLHGIARRRRRHCNRRAHIAVGSIADVFGTCVPHSKRIRWVCGHFNVCMMCGWLLASCLLLDVWRLHSSAGCLKVVGCWSLAFWWQCCDRRGRFCGPNCQRASRRCVCVCVCVLRRFVCVQLFVVVAVGVCYCCWCGSGLCLLLCLCEVCLDVGDTAL